VQPPAVTWDEHSPARTEDKRGYARFLDLPMIIYVARVVKIGVRLSPRPRRPEGYEQLRLTLSVMEDKECRGHQSKKLV
jgi:hypothetical protein